MQNSPHLDVLVRFHDFSRLLELKRCIFSLVGQTYRPLNIILLLQCFTPEQEQQLRHALQPLLQGDNAPTLQLHNRQQPEPQDARAHLMQAGIGIATGRYLAFLDYDDVLFPEAYQLLAQQLSANNAAIAFASVQPMVVDVYRDFCYSRGYLASIPYQGETLHDLFRHNFCPLHSYMFDRERIPPSLLQIDTSLTIEEDYALLQQVCAALPADFSLLNTTIGYYAFKTDASNTVAMANLSPQQQEVYARMSAKIEQRRAATPLAPSVQIALGFAEPHHNRTISQALQQLPRAASKAQST
ncbi:MAG: glycosyltransferase, partial [Desulfuromonas sp.]|nr:glycosyltransferase [Desulfuromonas sp.]